MLGLLYVIFGIVIISIAIIRVINRREISYITLMDIYFFGYYIVPGAVHNLFPNYRSRYSFAIQYGDGTYIALIAVVIAYFSLQIGYKTIVSFGHANNLNSNREHYIIPNEKAFWENIIYVLWIIGLISFAVHCYLYGGITQALFSSALIRNGDIVSTGSGALLFIDKFMPCLQYASYISFIQYLNDKNKTINFMVSLALTLLYFLANAGRGAIIVYIIVLIFIYSRVKNKKIRLRSWVTMFFITLLGVNYLRPLFSSLVYLRNGWSSFFNIFLSYINSSQNYSFSTGNLLYRLCFYLEHKYVSLEIAIKSIALGKYSYSFFVADLFVALIAIIPEAVLPFKKPETISYYNTKLIGEGYRHSTGTIPPGGVAFGYYSMGLIGVALFSYIFGIVGRKMSNYFDRFDSDYMGALKYVNAFIWITFFIEGDLRQGVVKNIVFFALLILVNLRKKATEVE